MAITANDVEPSTTTTGSRTAGMRWAGLTAMVLALLSGTGAFLVLMGLTPLEPTATVTTAVLLANLFFIIVLFAFILVDVRRLYAAWRAGRIGARLHAQMVGLFSGMAVVPAIVVAAVAAITLSEGLDRWFSERTRTIIGESVTVAQAYLNEHAGRLRGEMIAMANDINRAASLYAEDREAFQRLLTTQSALRSTPGTFIVRRDGELLMRSGIDADRDFPGPPSEALAKVGADNPVMIAPGNSSLVGGVIGLPNLPDLILYLVRPIDQRVLDHMRRVEEGTAEYAALEQGRAGVQAAFGLAYLSLALIVLACAIWLGLAFANQIVSPVRRLGQAADAISKGDFDVRVPVARNQGDLSRLGQTFNTMVEDLQSQRTALLEANAMSDRRRRFTEAVLSGVTAGVVGVNRRGEITLANRPVLDMLGARSKDILGQPLLQIAPELTGLLKDAERRAARITQGQVVLRRRGAERTLNVRVAHERGNASGTVITLDDITDLVAAQRTSAWADVARRIAHEIKNPLTPIRLSAERLRRKYGKVIVEDREIFEQCTQTIVRQVEDIGRMVDEFASFARMPKAQPEEGDLAETVKQATFLQRMANTELAYEIDLPNHPVKALIDRRLLTQAVTNIVKNAGEAVKAHRSEGGRIAVSLKETGGELVIEIADNGPGFPRESRQKLLEPYVTTRSEGTGLGLAIVKKIMDEHGGRIELGDSKLDGGGALVRLVLPAWAAEASADAEDDETLSIENPEEA